MDSLHLVDGVEKGPAAEAADRLREFRGQLYGCLGRRADELFELTDAVLCAEGSVRSLVGLCLVPEHRRGHGALYDALNHGAVDADRLRTRLAELPVPRTFGGRIVLAVDATPWLRPDAPTCPERLFCHVYGRGRGREADQQWPSDPQPPGPCAGHSPSATAAQICSHLSRVAWDRRAGMIGPPPASAGS